MHSRATAARTGRYFAASLVLCAVVARGGQPEPVGPATTEAVALCNEADRVSVAERSPVLARGLARAEEAVRADPQDAVAHFAVFCNLGKRLRLQMKQRGAGLFSTLGALGRVQKEIDIALTLAPDYAAALAAKGDARRDAPTLRGRSSRGGTPATASRGARSRRSADAPHACQRPPGRRGA
jgi:hypothetical protein